MFLPTGEYHVLLMRNRHARQEAEAEYIRLGYTVNTGKPDIWQRTRRAFGNAIIQLSRWVRGCKHSSSYIPSSTGPL